LKLVILGRDGVINAATALPILKPDEWAPLPGVREAISRLHRDGYRIVVVTNQPAVAQGTLKIEALNRIHGKMLEIVRQKGGEIEAFFICPHVPADKCRCRAPMPGLFEEVAERLKVNLSGFDFTGVVACWRRVYPRRARGCYGVRRSPGVRGCATHRTHDESLIC